MKKHEAVVEFKSKADRLAQFLGDKGHVIPHMQLMEGLALYEGYRDWRTFRAVLAGEAGQHKLAAPARALAADALSPMLRIDQSDIAKSEFFMGDKAVAVYVPPSSGTSDQTGLDFCRVVIDQQWVDSFYLVQDLSFTEQGSVSSVNLAAEWGPADIAWAMRDGVGYVNANSIWFSGMHSETGQPVSTDELRISELFSHVAKAIQAGESDAFLMPEGPALESVLHGLGKLRKAKVPAPTTEKFVTAYFSTTTKTVGLGPHFCSVQVTRTWLDKLRGLIGSGSLYAPGLAPDWVSNEHPWTIADDGVHVSGARFKFYASQKHGPHVESQSYDIRDFVEQMEAALGAAGASGRELFFLKDKSHIGKLMHQLNRTPGHPQYCGTPLTKQEQWALSSCLTYWGDLSYAEVLAILDGDWEGERVRLDANDGFVGVDDEDLAEAIREAYKAYGSQLTP